MKTASFIAVWLCLGSCTLLTSAQAQELPPPVSTSDAGPPAPAAGPADDQDAQEAPPSLIQLPLPEPAPAPATTQAPVGPSTPSMSEASAPPAAPAAPKLRALDPAADVASDADAAQEAPETEVESMPGDPWGDAQGLSVISLRALMQFRYVSTFAADSANPLISGREKEEYLAQKNDGWGMNRLLVRLSSDPVKYVGFKAVLDFSELSADPEDVLKQAYGVLRAIPERLEFVVGLFKLPATILELDPSSRFELANLGPTNVLVGNLGFAGRDMGVQVMVAPLKKPKRLRLSVGAFRGHAHDEHDSPAGSLAGRAETKPNKWLRLGADLVEHLSSHTYNRVFETSGKDVLPNPSDPRYPTQRNWGKGRAFSVDARIKKKGFMLRGEFMLGDRVDLDQRYGAKSFWSAWALAAYRIDLGGLKLIPAARAEWLDADREHGKGLWRTLSFGVTALFLERVRVLFDVTRTDVNGNTIVIAQPKPLQDPAFLALDNTRITAQVQLEL
jgi:hypothetical protein